MRARETCPRCYRLHMGPQKLRLVLGGNESVSIGMNTFAQRLVSDALRRQPILADEVQTFKALITIHKVLQEGHPIVLKQAQAHIGFLESLQRGVAGGEGLRGMSSSYLVQDILANRLQGGTRHIFSWLRAMRLTADS